MFPARAVLVLQIFFGGFLELKCFWQIHNFCQKKNTTLVEERTLSLGDQKLRVLKKGFAAAILHWKKYVSRLE